MSEAARASARGVARIVRSFARVPACVALLLIAAGSLGSGEREEHRALAPPRPDGFSPGQGWKVSQGAAYTDTFPFRFEDVLPVAAGALARDRWRIQSADTLTGRIVTEWQPVRHVFVRLFLGEVRERCVVDVTSLDRHRCRVTFRAALATRKSLAGNPLMPSVRKQYKKGVRDWQRRVRQALVERSRRR